MSDVSPPEKRGSSFSEDSSATAPLAQVYERPKGLKGLYYSPYTQVCMLGFVCFLCPGMFNALNGLGGGGQVDATTNSQANIAVYATFSVVAFFAGYRRSYGSRVRICLLMDS